MSVSIGVIGLLSSDLALLILILALRKWLGVKFGALAIMLMTIFSAYSWVPAVQGVYGMLDVMARFEWSHLVRSVFPDITYSMFFASVFLFAIAGACTLYSITALFFAHYLRKKIRVRIGERLPH